jgi:hypothetical protein
LIEAGRRAATSTTSIAATTISSRALYDKVIADHVTVA